MRYAVVSLLGLTMRLADEEHQVFLNHTWPLPNLNINKVTSVFLWSVFYKVHIILKAGMEYYQYLAHSWKNDKKLHWLSNLIKKNVFHLVLFFSFCSILWNSLKILSRSSYWLPWLLVATCLLSFRALPMINLLYFFVFPHVDLSLWTRYHTALMLGTSVTQYWFKYQQSKFVWHNVIIVV